MRFNNRRGLFLNSLYGFLIEAIGSSTLLGAARGLRLSALFWGSFSACGGWGSGGWAVRAQGTLRRVLGGAPSGWAHCDGCGRLGATARRALGSWGLCGLERRLRAKHARPKSPQPEHRETRRTQTAQGDQTRRRAHPAPALASPAP